MNRRKKSTIKDIAELSGVSVATVSRVINNNGRFSDETRKKVESVIEQYQYTANMAGKSLRQNQSRTIGMLVPDITNELFAQIVLEVEKFFFSHGYSVLVCNTDGEEDKEKAYFRILESKLVDGIICISGSHEISFDSLSSGIPIVCIDRKPNTDIDVDYVESDQYLGAYIATELLIKKGCKRIIILSRRKPFSTDAQRLRGYEAAMRDNHLDIMDDFIVLLGGNVNNYVESRDIVFYMIKKGVPFDGIFATNDWRAHGALVALQQNNIPVPEQVKIVGFDGVSVSKYCYPSITTIQQNKKELAIQASDILLRRITNLPVDNRHIVIPVGLIERGTT